jgi:hypothetical protein
MFELYVSLTNMYWLVCVLQSHKMRKIDKILCDLSAEERKILMEKLQKDEPGEWKIYIQYEFFFFEFSLIFYLKILDNMLKTIY